MAGALASNHIRRATPDQRVRLMIVDDSMVARAVLSRIVSADPRFDIVAVAGTAEDAVAALKYAETDIILLDLEMPGAGGLKYLPKIIEAARGAQVMIVSSLAEDGAEETVSALIKAGKRVILISGDSTAAVEALARRLGIPQWIAEALPQDKAARIKALTDEGARVLMVGDGLNDTAALAGAHVSISPATALDAARVASDIVLLGNSLAPLPEALTLSKKATRRIRENFAIATWYNVIAVPLAIAGLCSPLIAALAMSASSITVSLNALRLR